MSIVLFNSNNTIPSLAHINEVLVFSIVGMKCWKYQFLLDITSKINRFVFQYIESFIFSENVYF